MSELGQDPLDSLTPMLDVSQFPYVDAVLKEALRMEPPAGFGTLRQLREVGPLPVA